MKFTSKGYLDGPTFLEIIGLLTLVGLGLAFLVFEVNLHLKYFLN